MIVELSNGQRVDTELPGPETLGPYKVHPAINCFPLMTGKEFTRLAESIRGLLNSITLTHDSSTMGDGRCRYLACVARGVEPTFNRLDERYQDDDLINYVISMNLMRTHAPVVWQ